MRTPEPAQASPILDAALSYAALGWWVHPLRPKSKLPQLTDWPHQATTDLATIRGWCEKWPTANIGILTGAPSGLMVLDVDPRHGGDDALRELEAQHGALPGTIEALTPSGGRHVYFECPQGVTIRNSAGILGHGLDIRGAGGYVAVPPSSLGPGQDYAWEVEHDPTGTPLAAVPTWMLARLREAANRTSTSPNPDSLIPQGRRNDFLMRQAGAMRRRDMSRESILAALRTENRDRCQPPLGDDEVKRIAASAARYPPAEERPRRASAQVVITPCAGIEADHVLWAWRDKVALASTTMLVGNPGLGKTLLAIDMAARLSRGQLEGELCGAPTDVLVASAEDSPSHTLVPRLTAAGADLARVHLVEARVHGQTRGLILPEDVEPLAEQMRATNARLLIVDPFVAHLPVDLNSWRDQDVRVVLAALARMAEETAAAVLLIVHLKKGHAEEILHRVSGSVGMVAAARSVLLAADDPAGEDWRVLAHIKCNLGPYAPTLRYRIEERIIAPKGIRTCAIAWGGEAVGITRADLIAPLNQEEKSERAEAREWLKEALADGCQRAVGIFRDALKAGLSEMTLRRAKGDLGVKASKLGGPGQGFWTWSLPASSEVAHEDDQYISLDHLHSEPQKKSFLSNNLYEDDQGDQDDHIGEVDHLDEQEVIDLGD